MEKLLFLAHRIPYPPNKGDKIRSFNFLKYLSQHFEIYLGTFIDDPIDFQYQDDLKKYAKEVFCLPLSRSAFAQAQGAAKAFISHQAITIPCFYDKKMQAWIDEILEQKQIKQSFTVCSSMAPYLNKPNHKALNRVIDFIDVDSDKWRQYADSKSGPMAWVYSREHKLLAKLEKDIVENFDKSILVSPDEALFLKNEVSTKEQNKVLSIVNGVDTVFFDPELKIDSDKHLEQEQYIVFTGAMDYWANEEAVIWFSQHIWPNVKSLIPNLKFYIVGGKPSAGVQALSQDSQIIVTGRVEDIRPYIKNAILAVAPLRIARGIQNKVLEAMAMAKAVVMTKMAAEGINLPESQKDLISDEAQQTIKIIETILNKKDHLQEIGDYNRQWILDNYQWQAVLKPIKGCFDTNNLG